MSIHIHTHSAHTVRMWCIRFVSNHPNDLFRFSFIVNRKISYCKSDRWRRKNESTKKKNSNNKSESHQPPLAHTDRHRENKTSMKDVVLFRSIWNQAENRLLTIPRKTIFCPEFFFCISHVSKRYNSGVWVASVGRFVFIVFGHACTTVVCRYGHKFARP